MAKIRVYEVGERSRAKGLRLVERDAPVPGHGEAVVRIRATGLNARDLSIMFANAPTSAIAPTRVPLMDNAGDVLAVGPGVTRVKPGDRVTMTHYWRWLDGHWDQSMTQEDYSLNRDGFLAEQALMPADALVKIPESISYEEASTLQSAGLTAWNAVVEAGRAKASDTVVTLGTGGVSVFGLQWAKMLGARAMITSSSDDKLKRMTALGADDVINYRATPNWSQAVLDKTGGRGADIVLNTVGIGEMEQCLLACASGGRVMYIGANPVNRDRTVAQTPGLNRLPNLIIKDLTIKGIVVGSRRMYEDLLTAMARNKVKPVIDRVFPFEQVMDAVAYMESGDKVGKIVIRIS
ncbi:MAG: NAD(P)-dependent alcohol dehydrogenase [Rhodospirillaceae bacterium]|nr:NAD(P)-dependent alcohol dehydrogenase [Rhodospirillaceae bacterium]